ncbi:hypothetical protein CK203_027837 [Vitis vinifera]|uniref:Reverse transcriptase Ty1/copia-type domain-containing protein n=1 Tax=Vitis vinifera TaxID=29760 RepID=A0A438J3K9_VITVI|nr:hypothetical protein CK203_027837 [Vitis vinifera]
MDAKSAFLNGILNEEVYVEQPKGFQDLSECALDFANDMKSEFEMSMVGELTYFLGFQVKQLKDEIFLSQSKLDIAFSVGVCARYQAFPKESHLIALKCIIRYITDDRKSTSSGCFYIGNCLVAWMSKK